MSLDSIMSSCERTYKIIDLPQEPPLYIPSKSEELKKIKWPASGNLEFNNVSMRYQEGTDLVIRGVSFSIKSGEKIGVIGRTGAGKSSLIHALFRLTEIECN